MAGRQTHISGKLVLFGAEQTCVVVVRVLIPHYPLAVQDVGGTGSIASLI